MKKVKGKRRKDMGHLGFHEWSLDSLEGFEDEICAFLFQRVEPTIKKMIAEGMKLAEQEYDAFAWLNTKETQKQRRIMLDAAIPIGEGDCDEVHWTFPFSQAIIDHLEIFAAEGPDTGGKFEDHDGSYAVARIVRDEMRRLADELDRRMKE